MFFACHTGLRLMEILNLTFGQLRLWLKRAEVELIETKSGEKEYVPFDEEVIALLERSKSERERAEVKQLIETLKRGFSDNNSDEGLRALQQLIYEYKQLKPVLSHRKETDSLSIAHIPALT